MATMTFSSLKTQVANTLNRDDLTSRIPEFVDSGERRIARESRPRGFEKYTSSAFNSGSAGAVIDQPVRLEGIISFHVLADAAGTATGSIRFPIFRRSYSFVRGYTPNQGTTGRPRFYADMGQDQMIVAPSPSAAFSFELAYYERLAPLSDSNTTNWLTEHAPDLLFYATLLASALILKDDDRIQTWQKYYDDYKTALAASTAAFNSDDNTASSVA